MDAYISEAQLISCDTVDILHIDILDKDLIQPGHKTIYMLCKSKPRDERAITEDY
jgi:hypothetical protein